MKETSFFERVAWKHPWMGIFFLPRFERNLRRDLSEIDEEINEVEHIRKNLQKYMNTLQTCGKILSWLIDLSRINSKKTQGYLNSFAETMRKKERLLKEMSKEYKKGFNEFLREKGMLSDDSNDDVKKKILSREDIKELKKSMNEIYRQLEGVLKEETNTMKSYSMLKGKGAVSVLHLSPDNAVILKESLRKEGELIKKLAESDKWLEKSSEVIKEEVRRKLLEDEQKERFFEAIEGFREEMARAEKGISEKFQFSGDRYKESVWNYRCGLPKEAFYAELEKTLGDYKGFLLEKKSYLQGLPGIKPLKEFGEIVEVVENKIRKIDTLISAVEEIKEKIDAFTKLTEDPEKNRERIIELWKEINNTADTLTSPRKEGWKSWHILNYFLFKSITPLKAGGISIYHGIGTYAGERIETLKRQLNYRTPEEYAEAIIKRVKGGIKPSKSDMNYLSCSKLPAVYFYEVIGKWEGLCYIEVKTGDYAVFMSKFKGPQWLNEVAVYSKNGLRFPENSLVFFPLKNPPLKYRFTSKIGYERGIEAIDRTLQSLVEECRKNNISAENFKFRISWEGELRVRRGGITKKIRFSRDKMWSLREYENLWNAEN